MPLDLIETQTVDDTVSVHLTGATQVASVSLGGVTYVAVASTDLGLSLFSLSKTGVLTLVSEYTGGWSSWGFSSVAFAQVGGTTYLVARTIGSNDVVTFSLAAGGGLTQVEWGEHAYLEGGADLVTAKVGTTTFLIGEGTAETNYAGLGVLRLNADGSMTSTGGAYFDHGHAVRDVSVVQVGGSTFVVASTVADDLSNSRLAVYALGENGLLTGVDPGFGTQNWLTSTAAVVGGVGYVYAATATELVTYAMGADGTLTEVGSTSLGATPGPLTTGVIDGVTYLFQSDASGLTVYELGADGLPTVADAVADTGSNHLALAGLGKVVTVEGFDLYVAPSATESGLTVLTANPISVQGGSDDTVSGTVNGDYINGGDGNDTLSGGLGDDHLVGGLGGDVLNGEDGDDTLDGGVGDDYLNAGAGADSLLGGDGADQLFGGDGNDVVNGGAGSDDLIGGDGDDTYVVDNVGDRVLEGGSSGVDTVRASVSYAAWAGIENLVLVGAGLALQGFGNTSDNVITGTSGDNVLWGRAGDDTMNGGGGADTLWGEDDDDTLNGDAGNDLLYGEAGDDTLNGGVGNDRLDGGAGSNHLYGGKGDDIYIFVGTVDYAHEDAGAGVDTIILRTGTSITLAANVENLTIDVANNTMVIGNALANVVTGSAFAETIYAQAGNDTLDGQGGADWLYGHAGNDTLLGGLGDDLLVGGAGADYLSGGAGADAFAFGNDDVSPTASGGKLTRDSIVDLSFADGDVIDISGIDANIATGADDEFVWVSKFTKVAGQATIKYTAASDTTVVQFDVDGDGKADFQLSIAGDHTGTTGNWGGDGNGGWIL